MRPPGSLKYSVTRPQEHRKTTRFSRKEAAAEVDDEPNPPTQRIKVTREELDKPIKITMGKTEVTVEAWGDHVVLILPGAVRLMATRAQVTDLVAALIAVSSEPK